MKIRKFTILLAVMLQSAILFAQVTTSGISGKVTGKNNESLPGATITAVHVPSGTFYGVLTTSDGRFVIQGMRPGGPYKIDINYVGYTKETLTDVTLSLGDVFNMNVNLKESSTNINEVVVVGYKTSAFGTLKTGAATNITSAVMRTIPSLNRTLSDYTKLSPFSTGSGGFLGRDAYTTNITVDGANFNNNFGLSTSNMPGASGEPISMEAIDEIQVAVAPFDVRQSNFTGAGVNAITKSGTNTFKGSVYGFYRNQDFNGRFGRVGADGHPRRYTVNNSARKTYGATFGGPIIPNKLFFFVNAERDRTLSPGNTLTAMASGRDAADPNVNANVNTTDLQTFSDLLKQKYGYVTGPYENWGGDQDANDKLLARLDWNISKNHKFTIRYDYSKSSSPSRPSSSGDITPSIVGGRSSKSGGMSYENSQYFTSSKLSSLTAELNSRFGQLSNKLLFAYTKFSQPRTTPSSVFPFIDIMDGNVLKGNVRMSAGYELFSYGNNVDNNTTIITDNITYAWHKHVFTLGGAVENQFFANSYLRQGSGYYRFRDLAAFTNYVNGVGVGQPFDPSNDPIGFAWTYPINGYTNPQAELTFRQWSAYLQDEWSVLDNFKLTGGVRIDIPSYLTGAVDNPAVKNYAFRNGETVDLSTWPAVKTLWSPRLGFNWDVFKNRALTVRGGTGIFTGRIPFVWFTNQPTNSGMLQYQLAISGTFNSTTGLPTSSTANSQLARIPFFADATKLLQDASLADIFPQQNVVGGKIAAIDKKFELPQVWRSSLGFEIRLPQDFKLTLEGIYTRDFNSIYFDNINWKSATTFNALDGRPYYSSSKYITAPYQNVVIMRNTSKGSGYSLSAQLDIPKIAGFSGMIAVSRNWGEEVTNKSGSDPFSAWQYRIISGDPNAQELGYVSNYTPAAVSAAVNYTIDYAKHFSTMVSLVYIGYKGGAYSYVFSGDANGDGTTSNDLMYIPRGKYAYTWNTPADADAYFAFAANDPYLSKHAGEVAKRNGAFLPWYSRFDFRILQDFNLKFGKNNNKLEFIGDVINFGNLLYNEWGLGKGLASGGNSPLIINGRDATTGLLKVSMRKVGSAYMTTPFQDPTSISGLWGLQLGLRYSFN